MTGRSTYAGAGESAGVDWEQIGNKLAGKFCHLIFFYTHRFINHHALI